MATDTGHSPAAGYKHDDAWDEDFLRVSSIHRLHYEQYGKKDGKPVVFLHGGPGGSTSKDNTAFFDPSIYRIVLFDQRGSGKSEPVAELRENTSQLLVADIETLRKHLGIATWHMVFGGSWGSTLALLYAQTHPETCGSLVVRGIFTVRKSELEFTNGPDGAARIFPEAYEEMVEYLPPDDRSEPYGGYYKLLTSNDPKTRLEASKAYNKFELSINQLIPYPGGLDKLNDDTWSLQHGRMETHYFINDGFMEPGQLLKQENLNRIKHIPCPLVSSATPQA